MAHSENIPSAKEDARYEILVAKFAHYEPELTNSMKWACVIARFESLAYRRKMARDRLVFREDVLELMADEGVEEIDSRRARPGQYSR